MSILTRGATNHNYQSTVSKIANLLGVSEPVPRLLRWATASCQCAGMVCLILTKNNKPEDIDIFWEVFSQAIAFAKSDDSHTRAGIYLCL